MMSDSRSQAAVGRRWRGSVVALCGGVGGAKLALGLSRVLSPDALTIVTNTGDDFEHLGLHAAPDLDTVMYTLAGLNNPETGWGRAGESWTFMAALAALGGETWFQLGDGDLATHVERTRRLRTGETLSVVTADFARRLGVTARIVPMSDDPVRTVVHTDEGAMPFQEYFVRRRCAPCTTGISFVGAEWARPSPGFRGALAAPDLAAVIICPSNPFLSVDPMLAIPDVRRALAACHAPVVAVSPIVGQRAIKGPTAKIMAELGVPPTAVAVADHYDGLLDGFVLDRIDADQAMGVAVATHITRTVMRSLEDRETLAREVLEFARRLAKRPRRSRAGAD